MNVPRSLRDLVHTIDIVESKFDAPPVLPSSSVVLGVQWHGRLRGPSGVLSRAGVTGLQDVARNYHPIGETTSILVRFTPRGAAAFRISAEALTGNSVALDDLVSSEAVKALISGTSAAPSCTQACDVVTAFLSTLAAPDDAMVDAATCALDQHEMPRVAAVAHALGVSERTLERRFRARIGVSPKAWSALRRFERALEASSSMSFARASHDAGYYDQAQFTREFRRRTGVAPHRFLR